MDEVDRQILDLLQEDGRMRYREIGKRLGIPEATVRYRMKSMIRDGVIRGFTVVRAAPHIACMVAAKADPKADLGEICRNAMKLKGIQYTYELTGEYDFIAFITGDSPQELNQAIDGIRGILGVASTTTFLVLREHR